jgi:hypothetical protein
LFVTRTGGSKPQETALRLSLDGAAPSAPQASGLLVGQSNYFLGQDPAQWHRQVPHFGRVDYPGIYPGIDLTYYGKERSLEYDFRVSADANPADIALRFPDHPTVTLTANGDLQAQLAGASFLLHRPAAYQDVNGKRAAVDAQFALRPNGSVGFQLGEYDPTQPLVIDPVVTLTYATYLGTNAVNAQGNPTGVDEAFAVAADAAGDAFVVSATSDTSFPVTPGAFQKTYTGCPNCGLIAVSKFDPTGSTLLYSTFIGGSGQSFFPWLAVNSQGEAVITSTNPGSGYPLTANAYATSGLTVVTQLNSAGSGLLYSSYFSYDTAPSHSIAVDDSGFIYLIGPAPANFEPLGNAFQGSLPAGATFAAYLAKLDPTQSGTASLVYASYVGSQTTAIAVAVDAHQNAFVAGNVDCNGAPSTCSTTFAPIKNAFQSSMGGLYDGFIVKVNTTANGSAGLVYGSYLGGPNNDLISSVTLDSSSNAYITGGTAASTTGTISFPTTTGAYQTSATGGSAAFLTKVSSNGQTLLYSTLLGNNSSGTDVAVDGLGQAHLLGTANGANFPLLGAYAGSPAQGNYTENFLTGLNTTASGLLYSTFIPEFIMPSSVAVDPLGNAYIAGAGGDAASVSGVTDFQPTPGAFQQTCGKNLECGFLMKLKVTGATGGGGGGSAVTISNLTPNEAGQDDTFTITISGSGFESGATVAFSNGSTTTTASQVAVATGGASLTAEVTLHGSPLGLYDLTITNPDETSGTAQSVFTVVSSVAEIVSSGGGVAGSVVTTSIYAPAIEANAVVTLQLRGSIIATGTNLSIANGAVTTTFDLTAVPPGVYDVVILNPDGTVITIPQGFTVGTTGASQPTIDIVGRMDLRAGQQQYYYIVIGNQGNEDAELVHFHVEFPAYFGFTLGVPLGTIQPTSPLPAGTVPYDESLAPPGQLMDDGNMGVDLYLPYLAAGATYSIPFEFLVPDVSQYAHVPFTITAQIDPDGFLPVAPTTFTSNLRSENARHSSARPEIAGGLTPAQITCLQKLALTLLILIPAFGGLAKNAAIVAAGTAAGLMGSVLQFDNPLAIQPVNMSQIIWDVVAGALALAGIAWPGLLILSAVVSILSHLDQLIAAFKSCQMAFPPPPQALPPAKTKTKPNSRRYKSKPGQTITSGDPNDKSGPVGAAAAQYIQPRLALPYGVFFENDATASAPAQTVTVTDQLDPTKVDLTTFSFGPVYIANQIFTPEPGSQGFTGQIDLRPANDIIASFTGTLAPATGLLQWTFTSLDPTTGQPTTNPNAGFLPPNTPSASPNGDGAVSFSVKAESGLATGTAITNQATVVFDQNAPILTPVWTNTIDQEAPVSKMTALPTTQPALFNLAWSGTDVGSGIAQYNIYVSDNGGPFQLWQPESATLDTYSGTLGHTYGFYSIAEDAAGNFEGPKTAAEASTTVSTGSGSSSIALQSTALQILPRGTATVTATVSGANPTGTLLFTINEVAQPPITLAGATATLNVSNLPGGYNDISAFYSGDSVNAPSTAGPLTITVLPALTTLALTIPQTEPGSSAQIGVTASNSAGPVSGAIQLTVNNVAYPATLTNNKASVTVPALPAGSYPVLVAFIGSGDQSQAIATGTLVVAAASSITTLTSSASGGSITAGQTLTLTATVTGTGSGPAPTGTVQFSIGATSLGKAQVSAYAVATLAVTTLPVGSDTLTAAFLGDTNYAASSGTLTLTVVAAAVPTFTLALSTQALTISSGGSVSQTVTISPQNGFNQPVTFACSGLPADATCSFSPASLTPGGTSSSTSTLTVTRSGRSALVLPATGYKPPPDERESPLMAISFLGLVAVSRRRFRVRASSRWARIGGISALFLLALLFATAFLTGCGSSQAIHKSTVTVVATAGTEVEKQTFTLIEN